MVVGGCYICKWVDKEEIVLMMVWKKLIIVNVWFYFFLFYLDRILKVDYENLKKKY